ADAVGDKLETVAVSRDYKDLVAFLPRTLGERGKEIIGLVALQLDRQDAQGLKHLADQRELLAKYIGSRGTIALVFGVGVNAKLRRSLVEAHDDAVGLLVGKQLDEHRGKPINRVRDLPGRGNKGIGERVESTESKRMTVKEQ